MKTKKHVGLAIFLLIFFSIIYIILAAKPLNKEYSFTPVWKISTANPVLSNTSSKPQAYFHLGQTLGYFDSEGIISLYQTFPSKVSISNSYYATYNSEAKNTEFFNADGSKAGVIEASGFPYFSDNLVYVFLPGGCSFSKCSETGKILWTFEGTFPITAFVAKQNYTAVGLSNGSIKVLNNETGATEIDFGQIPIGVEQTQTITISNIGQNPLVIEKTSTSCGCTIVENSKEPIAPNQKTEVTIKYNPDKKGFFSKTVTIYCNTGKMPLQIRVKGNVI